MLIEITTNGFVAEPVLWQTSTFWPAVDGFALEDCECALLELAWAEAEAEVVFFGFFGLVELLEWLETLVLDVAFPFALAFVFPGAFVELPCADVACFCLPGALPELPGGELGGPFPFPAAALPLNATAASRSAIAPPRPCLRRCIVASPGVEGQLLS
jgi:hypothetical protein